MKNLNKVLVLVLSAIMVLAMSASVFAQTEAYTGADGDGAKITITNAANGETYKIAKLFDATVTGTTGGSIAYQGAIPTELNAYFTKNATTGEITSNLTDADWSTQAVQDAFKAWAENNVTASAVSDGSVLEFTNLPYGYYVITTTQGQTKVTVNSTNPNAEVIDKNTTPPVDKLKKVVKNAAGDEIDYASIGDTVTYTISFNTSNFDSDGNRIDKYVIQDTLPDFLSDVTVTSIKVGTTALTVQQFVDKKIEITWAENNKNLYANGAEITITYTAKITDKIKAGDVNNDNKVTVTPYHGTTASDKDKRETTETIKTYAAAIQKLDENREKLAGATFQIPGLTVTGSNGNYTVSSYDPTSTAAGTTMACDSNGLLVIRGIYSASKIYATEVDAPDGYNKLEGPVEITPVLTSTETTVTTTTTTTTTYYDSEGNVVDHEVEGGTSETVTTNEVTTNTDLVSGAIQIVNKKGVELPATGGIGTTIFYVLGSLLVIGCGIVLVSRRRMQKNK